MTKTLKKLISAVLLLLLTLSVLASCAEPTTKLGNLDYQKADLSKYISLSESEYQNNTVTLGTEYIIGDEDVEEQIKSSLFKNRTKTNGDTQVTDKAVAYGDSAFIYYTGYLDGKEFQGGSNASDKSPYELGIGSGSFIPGFEDGLVGAIPSETSKYNTHDITLTFPEDYHSADMAGKTVVFKVWIEYIIQYTVPELTDDYVKTTLKFDGTADEYKAKLKTDMQAEATAAAEAEAINATVSKLISKAELKKYPEASVDYWYAEYIKQYESYMQYYNAYGYNFKSLDEFVPVLLNLKTGADWKAETETLAKEMVANELIYNLIAKQQEFTVSEKEFDDQVTALIAQYSSATKTYTRDEIIEEVGEELINQNILFEKVEKHILDNTKIEYKD